MRTIGLQSIIDKNHESSSMINVYIKDSLDDALLWSIYWAQQINAVSREKLSSNLYRIGLKQVTQFVR